MLRKIKNKNVDGPYVSFFAAISILFMQTVISQNANAFAPISYDQPKNDVVTTPPTNDGAQDKDDVNAGSDGDLIRARWESRNRDGDEWTRHVYEQLSRLAPNLLDRVPRDISQFCANYKNLSRYDRKNFWVYFMSAIAELESSHNPNAKYQENFRDRNGNYIISRGLLQISIESGNGYGCGFRRSSDLHNPEKNLDCGLRILNKWIGRDGRIAGKVSGKWRGGARYWSVLRTSSKVGKIKRWTKSIRICLR